MDHGAPFRLIDCFYSNEPVIDRWTFVFNEVNPFNGYHMMLATDDTGFGFSQFCEGLYHPDGDNSHLGYRPQYIGGRLVDHVLGRIGDD